MQFLYMDAPVKEAIVHGAKMSFFSYYKRRIEIIYTLIRYMSTE